MKRFFYSIFLFSLFVVNSCYGQNSFVFRGNRWGDSIDDVKRNENNKYEIEELITLKILIYTNIDVSIYKSFLYYYFENDRLIGAKYTIKNDRSNYIFHYDDEERANTVEILKQNLSELYGNYIESNVMRVIDVSESEYPFTILEDTYNNDNVKFYKWTYLNNAIYLRIYDEKCIDLFYGNSNFYNNSGSLLRDEYDEIDKIEEKNEKLRGL